MNPKPTDPHPRPGQGGFVLVAVLALLVVLSLLAAAVAVASQRAVAEAQLELDAFQGELDMLSTRDTLLFLASTQRMTLGGLTVNEAKARLEAAGFATGAVIEKPSNAPKGTVIGTDPAYRAPKGTAVAVIVSNGTAPKPTTTTTKPGGKPTGTVKPPRRR